MVDATRSVYAENGLRTFYKGYTPAIISLSPFIAINFATFDTLKTLYFGDKKFSKKGNKPFAIVVLEDLTDSMELIIFGEAYAGAVPLMEAGKLVAIQARVELREEEALRLSAIEVRPLKRPPEAAKAVRLKLALAKTSETELLEIRDALQANPGMRSVVLQFEHPDGRRLNVHPAEQFRVAWDDPLKARLGRWLVES